MGNVRGLIVEWIKANGCPNNWVAGLYFHLTQQGVSPDDALAAMNHFVDDLTRLNKSRQIRIVE